MVVLVRIDFTVMSLHPALGFENFVGRKYGQLIEAVHVSVVFVLLYLEFEYLSNEHTS